MLRKNNAGCHFKLSKNQNMLCWLRKHRCSNAIYMVEQVKIDWIKQNSDSIWGKSLNRSYIDKNIHANSNIEGDISGGGVEQAVMYGDRYYVSTA